MPQLSYTKKSVFTSACIALCVVLPMIFHSIPNAGNIWLPMHIPVLLCGMICDWKFGLFCGIMGPIISSILTQMPPAAYLPAMMLELAVYGMFSGLVSSKVHTGKQIPDLLFSLLISMILGRIVYGVVNALLFRAGNYSFQAWITSSFITALPGILLQFILIPSVIITLQKASLIPERY